MKYFQHKIGLQIIDKHHLLYWNTISKLRSHIIYTNRNQIIRPLWDTLKTQLKEESGFYII